MTRLSDNPNSSQKSRCSISLIVQGLGWASVLSLWGGGSALAVKSPATEPIGSTTGATELVTPASEPAVAPPLGVAPAGNSADNFESGPATAAPSPVTGMPSSVAAPPSSTEAVTGQMLVVPAAVANDVYIDRTGYDLGATQRQEVTAAVVKPVPQSLEPVQIGPVALSAAGIQVNSATAPEPDYTSQRFDLQQYYNRTVRPPGRLGNGNISLIFPLSIPAPITSLFGWRVHPITGDRRVHSGVDLGAPQGTPVLAAYTGRVILADVLGGYGLAIVLEHNQGTQQTLYAHLSEIFVKPGDSIQQGMAIGRVGSTGLATGPHLHFEFRQKTDQGWVAMDPGTQLEYALAQLVKALNTAQIPGKGQG